MNRLLFSLIIFISCSLSAQEKNSFTELERKGYSGSNLNLNDSNSFKQNSLEVHTTNQQLTKKVFGYLPDWIVNNNLHTNINFDLLTHLAVFSFSADSLGGLQNPAGWPSAWDNILLNARSKSVKIIMTVTAFETNLIHKILTNESVKQNFFSNIKNTIAAYSLSGVNIDFENLYDGDKNTVINNFMLALKNFLKDQPSLEISFASPIVGYGLWDFIGLADACDYLFVMAYDFYGSWSPTSGPSAPLKGTYFNITKSFNEDYYSVPAGKIILGVPYFGNYWKTKTESAYSNVDSLNSKNGWQKIFYYSEIIPSFSTKQKMWDSISETSWLAWNDTTWKQIWYDDEISLSKKYDFALAKNFAGIGLWALGYDFGRNELWDLIRQKFTPNYVNDNKNIPDDFFLYQNYPNPFNPGTVISYQLPTASLVTIKICDLLGKEITTLVNEYQLPGKHDVQFSILNVPAGKPGSQFSSGVYFYTIKAGNFVKTKKMIISK